MLAVGEGRGHIYISSVSSLSFQLPIATDKRGYPHNIFFISLQKTYVVGTQKRLAEALLMSTHNMFLWRNKKDIRIFWMKKVPFLLL